MIHHKIDLIDGVYTLSCCKVKLKPPVTFPVHCNCSPFTKGLIEIINECPHRGEPTGEMVHCGCPSNDEQPVYNCSKFGEVVRFKAFGADFKGEACIACPWAREEWTRINSPQESP